MNRVHTYLGYYMQNGIVMVDEEEADMVRAMFDNYLSGMGYIQAAAEVGISMYHASVKRIFQNRHYLGDSIYPQIVDDDVFEAAEEERKRRSAHLKRDNRKKKKSESPIIVNFSIAKRKNKYSNPYREAEYIYSLIERGE